MRHITAILIVLFIYSPIYPQQNDTTRVYRLEKQIEVIDKRISASFETGINQVTVIDKEEISETPVTSINELLEFISEADVRQRGNYGVQADISIAGGSVNQTVVLLNGINVTDPQTGHLTMNLPLSLDAVSRIEVLSGAAASVGIPKPFAGAINIITDAGSKNSLTARAVAGPHSFADMSLSASIAGGERIGNFISAGRTSSSGYRENTDFVSTNAFWHGKYTSEKYLLNSQIGFSDKYYGAGSFYTPVYPNQAEANKTYFAALSADVFSFIDFSPQIYFRRNTDRFELFREGTNAPDWYSGHNRHRTDIIGTGIDFRKKMRFGTTRASIDFRKESILSNNIGYPADSTGVPGTDAYYTKKYERINFAASIGQTLNLSAFHISFGAALDYSDETSEPVILPGIDLEYELSETAALFASGNISRRLPTFTERFYLSKTNIGNPDLLPETARTVEAGILGTFKSCNMKAKYFVRDGKNIIDWVRQPDSDIWTSSNITELTTQGVLLGITLNRSAFESYLPFIRKINFSYNYFMQNKNSRELISKYALDYLRHKADFSIHSRAAERFTLTAKISYQDRAGSFTEYKDNSYGKEKEYEPFFLADTRISYDTADATVFVECSNLLNETYFDFGNIPNPGRTIRIGTRISLHRQ